MTRWVNGWKPAILCILALTLAAVSLGWTYIMDPVTIKARNGGGPRSTNSSTIALCADDQYLWVVNQDVNTVTVFNVANDAYKRVAEIPVGREPRTVALTPDYAFVTNMLDANVSVISTSTYEVLATIDNNIDFEPYGVAVAPDGQKGYVTNASSNTVSVFNTNPPFEVTKVIDNVGVDPRGIAITADGTRVFITQFFARFLTGVVPGADNEKEASSRSLTARPTRSSGR